MTQTKIFKNSLFSVLQTIIIAAITLIIYKVIILQVGLMQTGVWSYLSSILTITALGSFGFASSLVYYVPKYNITKDLKGLNNLINTSFIYTTLLTSILCAIAYLIFHAIIPHTIDKAFINSANGLLPLIIISFFFSGASATYLAVLDGLGQMHIRSKIVIVCSIVYLFVCVLLIRKFGLMAIPIAETIKNIFILTSSFVMIKKLVPSYSFSMVSNKAMGKMIFKYGFNFQIISITQLVSDPFMKSIITKFSGSENTAIFDICLKILGAFRGLIIAANQSISPQITIFKTSAQENRIKTYYKANFRLVSFFGTILLLGPIMFADFFSIFFIGKQSTNFNFFFCCLSIALFINTISSPAHFVYIGTGNIKWTVLNNIIAAGLMFIIAPLFGIFLENKYIVLGWCLPTMIGSSVLIYMFGKQNDISAWNGFYKDNLYIGAAIFFAATINFYFNSPISGFNFSFFEMIVANSLVAFAFTFYPIWRSNLLKSIFKKYHLPQKHTPLGL